MKFAITITALTLTACATGPQIPAVPDVPVPVKSQLSARTLAPGDCGLFVWSTDAQKRFILFTDASGQKAVWHDGSRETRLTSLTPFAGIAPKQRFESGALVLSLDLRSPQIIDQGTRYKAGILKKKDSLAETDERVTPVVGLSSCSASG